MTIVNDTIVQLTWQEHIGFVYDKTSFELLKNFGYPTEGWGLTFDGIHLIMSDGSNNLYFFDPLTFQQTGQIQVQDNGTAVSNLNELEYINGDLYANIFTQQKIVIINPETGQVKAWLDLTGLQDLSGFNSEMVLNGIAYDAQTDRLFVTGKDWQHLFEIKLVPATLDK
jgi:glutaminyl-peptide cyclotransferase